jgi:hypothetical protein
MGAKESKPAVKPFTKIQIELLIAQMKSQTTGERDLRVEALMNSEASLLAVVKARGKLNNWLCQYCYGNVGSLKWIKGANITLQYLRSLESHTIQLEKGQTHPEEVQELVPAIATVIWASTHLNLKVLTEWTKFVDENLAGMNQKWVNSAKDGENVDEAIKKNFKSLLPTPMEIDLYLKSFFARNVMEEEIKQSA